MAMPRRTDRSIYRLKITLQGIRPPVWRRVEVPGTISLADLSQIIQAVMGWGGGHLHEFQVGGRQGPTYGDRDLLQDSLVHNERTARLQRVAPRVKDRLDYLYDFGDSWEHTILVEAIGPADPAAHYPRCTAGRRACPPDDCGGVWGYADLLEALADPEHPEHEEMAEWVDEDFNPDAFALAAANARLGHRRAD